MEKTTQIIVKKKFFQALIDVLQAESVKEKPRQGKVLRGFGVSPAAHLQCCLTDIMKRFGKNGGAVLTIIEKD